MCPQSPGLTHTRSVASIIATRARLVGLNTCFPRTRMRYLPAMVTTPASTASHQSPVRSSSASESPEMRGLRGSKLRQVLELREHQLRQQARAHQKRHPRQGDDQVPAHPSVDEERDEDRHLVVARVPGQSVESAHGPIYARR